MHNSAHGEVPNQIIEVDPNVVASFLGRIEDPVNSAQKELNIINDPAQRTLMNIQFITRSLIDFSESKSRIHEAVKTISNILYQFEGRLVKQNNNNSLVSFKTAHKAVLCAIAVKKYNNKLLKAQERLNFDIKIGLATGMPVNNEKAFFEDTIKLAHSLCFLDNKAIVLGSEVKEAFLIENLNNPFEFNSLYYLPLLDENFLFQLIDFVENNWRNMELRVEDFSNSLGMSKTLVYRKMIALTGKSPNHFIREFRLNKALVEMNLNLKSISQIAFDSGFNSTSYFSKCFKKRFGLLPSEIIKSNK